MRGARVLDGGDRGLVAPLVFKTRGSPSASGGFDSHPPPPDLHYPLPRAGYLRKEKRSLHTPATTMAQSMAATHPALDAAGEKPAYPPRCPPAPPSPTRQTAPASATRTPSTTAASSTSWSRWPPTSPAPSTARPRQSPPQHLPRHPPPTPPSPSTASPAPSAAPSPSPAGSPIPPRPVAAERRAEHANERRRARAQADHPRRRGHHPAPGRGRRRRGTPDRVLRAPGDHRLRGRHREPADCRDHRPDPPRPRPRPLARHPSLEAPHAPGRDGPPRPRRRDQHRPAPDCSAPNA